MRVSEGRLDVLQEMWKEGTLSATAAEKIIQSLRHDIIPERVSRLLDTFPKAFPILGAAWWKSHRACADILEDSQPVSD